VIVESLRELTREIEPLKVAAVITRISDFKEPVVRQLSLNSEAPVHLVRHVGGRNHPARAVTVLGCLQIRKLAVVRKDKLLVRWLGPSLRDGR